MEIKNSVTRIETQQLILRPFISQDASELIYKLTENKQTMLPWIGWVKDEPESLTAKIERIGRWQAAFDKQEDFTFAILLKDTGELIGSCMLFTRRGPGKLEIGYWIDKAQTGRGFATECSYALSKMAFEHIGIEQVLFYTDVRNVSSGRIPEKLGFAKEYTYREIYKDDQGQRIQVNVWTKFIEEYAADPRFEPVELLEL